MLLLALLTTARAACPAPLSTDAWTQRLEAAEVRMRALDPEGFRDGVEDALIAVPCLDRPLDPTVAARFHLLRGLAQYTHGDPEGARLSFAAASSARPGIQIDFTLVPEGHEVHELVQTAGTPGATTPADPPETGALRFDGSESPARPVDRPTLAQWIREDGDAGASAYLAVGDAMLAYPLRPAPPEGPTEPTERRPPSALRISLGIGAGVAALGAVGLYGLGASQAGKLQGPHADDVTRDDLEAIQARANRWVTASAVAGGVAGAGLIGFTVVR